MSKQFLCESHKKHFSQEPIQAKGLWKAWMEFGKMHFESGEYEKAIQFVGSSFDVAALMLDLNYHFDVATLNSYERLILSGHSLAECFKKVGNKQLERHYLLATHHKLMYEYRNKSLSIGSIKKPIEISLFMLKRHYEFYNEYEQIRPCYEKDFLSWRKMQLLAMH